MSISGLFPIDKWDFNSGSVLRDLPRADLELLLENESVQLYRKGENIFREGAFAAGIFYIISGKAKKYKVDKEGKEQIIYVANTGELLGYHAILAGERYPDFAAALEESKIAFIPKEDFLATLRSSEELGRRLLKTLSHEFTVLVNSVTLFAQKSVRERLATQLIRLREKYKAGTEPGRPIEINMSRDDLASLTGAVRENVIRVLSGFREAGIIEVSGRKIIVLDVKKLIAIADFL